MDIKRERYFKKFNDELQNGINYYRTVAQSHHVFPEKDIRVFNNHLDEAERGLHSLGISEPEEAATS